MHMRDTCLWHLCCSFLPPISCPCSFAVGHQSQSRDGWAACVSCGVKLGHVTEPPPRSRLCLDTSEEPLVLYSASQPQQRSGDKHWGQGGVGTPQVATWAGTWALFNSFQLCLCYILSGASTLGRRALELRAAITANQFLVHANWWFVTCKHKEKTGEHRSQLSIRQKSRENHNSHSGPERPPQILQAKRFCFFFFPFCVSGVRIDHCLQSSTSNNVMDMVI